MFDYHHGAYYVLYNIFFNLMVVLGLAGNGFTFAVPKQLRTVECLLVFWVRNLALPTS